VDFGKIDPKSTPGLQNALPMRGGLWKGGMSSMAGSMEKSIDRFIDLHFAWH
jgi:hypothetical protein